MSKEEEMKFDALAALIANNHEENKTRMKDLYTFVDFRFNGIEEHNKKQNGSIAHALQRIAQLEQESNERGVTCRKTVELLESKTQYIGFMKWVNDHPKISLVLLIILLLILNAVIHVSIGNGWLFKLWELIV